jgi:hypothetical protein
MRKFSQMLDQKFDEIVGKEWRSTIIVLAFFAYLSMC